MEETKCNKENSDELFEVWVRMKPFEKFDISSYFNNTEKSFSDSKSKFKFKGKNGKWANCDFQKREKDYKAIYVSDCDQQIIIK